jgi:hypothetical protein
LVKVRLPKDKPVLQKTPIPPVLPKESRGGNIAPSQPEDNSLAKLILAKIPDFNPEWTEETQKSWLDTINKLMDRLEKKPEN